MAVKVCINGQTNKIDTTLHKPVIFLNGSKKVLAKAWTFVNGEKIQLWGQEGVHIDYIKANGLVSGYNDIIAVGENWLITSGQGNGYYENVVRWDISNVSSPTVVQNAAWGTVKFNGFNGYKSVGSNSMYFTADTTEMSLTAGNELLVNPQTGVITINDSLSTTANQSAKVIGVVGLQFLSYRQLRASGYGGLKWTYGTQYYFDTTMVRQTGDSTPGAGGFFYYKEGSGSIQTSNTEVLVQTNLGTYLLSASAFTEKSTTIGDLLMYDGTYIIAKRQNGFGVYNKTNLSEVRYHDADSGDSSIFIGKNGNYYYTVEYNSSSAKLLVLNVSDLSLKAEVELSVDPFDDGMNFWDTAFARPQVTQSGFLGVSGRTGLANTRIIRFSEMFD